MIRHLRPLLGVAAVVALLGALPACGPQTALISTWEIPSGDVGPYDNVVVLAAMRGESASRQFESVAAATMRDAGLQVTAGHVAIDDLYQRDRDDLDQMVDEVRAEAVVIYKLIAIDEDYNYVPPTSYSTAFDDDWWSDRYWGYYHPYPYHYWGYWSPAVEVTAAPGYWTASTDYRVETAVYRTSDDKLVWSAVSATDDPDDVAGLADSVAGEVGERLRDIGVLRRTEESR